MATCQKGKHPERENFARESPVILSGVRISHCEILAESKDPYKLIKCRKLGVVPLPQNASSWNGRGPSTALTDSFRIGQLRSG